MEKGKGKGKGKEVMRDEVSGKEEGLYPIKPYQRGEGLPYAPVDWPNPGDTWYWSVGSRTTIRGFYTDRHIYPPERLRVQDPNIRFRSKAAVKRYITSQFPNADVDEFFASFTWMVPATRHPYSEVLPDEIASKRRKETTSNFKRTKKARRAMSQAFPRRRTRQSYKMQAQAITRYDESVIDLCSLKDDSASDGSEYSIRCSESPLDDSTSDGSGYSKRGSEASINIEDIRPDLSIGPSCNATTAFEAPDAPKVKEFHAQFCEDVDECQKSLEAIPFQHNDEARVRTPLAHVGSDMVEEMSSYRKKLSSILALDSSCWLSSKYLEEISFLVEKLATDPTLTVDQLLKLKLVEEIPKIGKFFLRAEGIAEQANKFFGDLTAMKDKFSSNEREFSELKKGVGELQSQIDSESSLVREIDEQIAQLQSREAELARDLKLKNEAKVQMVAEQEIMEKSVSAVIREIQEASAEIPAWNMKKENAEKQMADILARYAHLKGFSFEKPGASCAPSAPPYVASSATWVPSYTAPPHGSVPPCYAHFIGQPATDLAYPLYSPYNPVAYPPPPRFPCPPSAYPPPPYPPMAYPPPSNPPPPGMCLVSPYPPPPGPSGMCLGSPYPPPPIPPSISSGLQSGIGRS